MSELRDRLEKLVEYWIDHTREHEEEMTEWAGKAAPLGTQVAEGLRKAAARLAEASAALEEAKRALPDRPGGQAV